MTWRRAILGVAGVVALGVVCLVGATNVALKSDWLSARINSDPATLLVTYTRARSFSPGRLRFDTLVIRSRDSNIEWEARLEGVTVSVRLLDLLRRRLGARSVRANTLTFRLRERLERSEATPARLARYPRIAGFGEPPLRDRQNRPAHAGNPWRIVVDDLSVGVVREIWIDSWHWTGTASLGGGLDLFPGHRAEVFPAELSFTGGTLRFGEREAFRETMGTLRAALPRFETQEYPGNEVWKIMSGTVLLRGALRGLDFLSADGEGLRVAGGIGSARIGVVLDGGRGRARVDVDAGRVVAKTGPRVLRGSARTVVHAREIDFREGVVSFSGSTLALSDLSLDGAAGEAWAGSFTTPAARVHLTDGSLDARVVARLRDGRPLVALLPSGPPKWLAGLVDLRDFGAEGHVLHAPGRLTIAKARAEAGTFSLSGDYRQTRRRTWGALLVRKGGLSVGVGLGSGAAFHISGATEWFESEGRPGGLRTDQPRETGDVAATRRSK
ncbi:MAG: hypothetical protein PT977_00825 [Acidobacteriota bacterium]|nr:hypothetical protein [Acidobacteriota bacterium]